MNKEKYKYRI